MHFFLKELFHLTATHTPSAPIFQYVFTTQEMKKLFWDQVTIQFHLIFISLAILVNMTSSGGLYIQLTWCNKLPLLKKTL